jgi:hypothetical protein
MKQLPAQQTHKEKEGRKEVGPAAAVGPAPVYHPTLCKWEGMRFFISFHAIGEKEGEAPAICLECVSFSSILFRVVGVVVVSRNY